MARLLHFEFEFHQLLAVCPQLVSDEFPLRFLLWRVVNDQQRLWRVPQVQFFQLHLLHLYHVYYHLQANLSLVFYFRVLDEVVVGVGLKNENFIKFDFDCFLKKSYDLSFYLQLHPIVTAVKVDYHLHPIFPHNHHL